VTRVQPSAVVARSRKILDVQVQRRRILGKLRELGRPGVRRSGREQVDECDHGDDAAATPRTRGDGRGLEPAGEGEEGVRLLESELEAGIVVVHEHQSHLARHTRHARHARKVAPSDPTPPAIPGRT
jgi:hypothetical protein